MDFNPETALLGGMSLLAIHQVIMAQVRRFVPEHKRLERFFDLLNYPIAFILMLLISPPWPIYSSVAWSNYISFSIATAALASIVAGKVIAQEKKQVTQLEQDVRSLDTLVDTLESKADEL